MPMSILELYDQTIRSLPAAERLRLAKLILNDIPPESVADYSEEWTEEDYEDFTRSGWARAETALGGQQDD